MSKTPQAEQIEYSLAEIDLQVMWMIDSAAPVLDAGRTKDNTNWPTSDALKMIWLNACVSCEMKCLASDFRAATDIVNQAIERIEGLIEKARARSAERKAQS